MGETNKQVRVDNWGIFFLQRLQLFFNKTDYCDLTLQFEGNVQLKVHRLVMNACTDYFNDLEQSCEVIDGNTLVMPQDLQADVILPIVNFMYTGMLEFQMSIFEKLYHTAELMNIPVLTKLLDAQKKPITPIPKLINKKLSSTWNLQGKKSLKIENDLPLTLPGRKLPVWKRKTVPNRNTQHFNTEVKSQSNDVLQDNANDYDNVPGIYDNTPKPTRFEWPEDEISSTFNLMDNSFDDISYTSKPLLTQDDELRASTSFDNVKHQSPPLKKSKDYGNQSIDMEEVKNYVKEQKIRSDLNDYDDEDDPDYVVYSPGSKRKNERMNVGSKRVKFNVNEKENKETKINVTPSGKTSDMDHTKIISEVLKRYPHLMGKNKNIRLKIMAKSPSKSDSHKGTYKSAHAAKLRVQVSSPKGSPKPIKLTEPSKNTDDGPWTCMKCSTDDEQVEFVLYYLYRKHMTDVHNEKFDSRMCKFCGHQSSKHNMLMYHQYTRHGIKPPAAYNFPKCNRCPYIALTENLLIKHKLNHTKFDLQCGECKVAFNSQVSLSSHMQITGHSVKSGKNSYDCQYCTKRYQTGSNLFSHIKLLHRDEARRDGIVSIDESEDVEDVEDNNDNEEYILPEIDSKEKVKIISNIKVPPSETQSESVDSINNVANMATSLGLVDIVVLDNDQQYILHDDQQLVATQEGLSNSQSDYILPEITEQHSFAQSQSMAEVISSEHNVITQTMLNSSDIATTDELVMVLTDHDYNDGAGEILTNDNSNIVVLYSHPVDGQQNQYISQGNLMLNSETGLLEIRNDTNTGQETQIESIELIQREINNHSCQSTKDEASSAESANVEPITQSTPDKQVEEIESEKDTSQSLMQTEMREETVVTMSDDNDEKVQEVPMEIDEDCPVEDYRNEDDVIETTVIIDCPRERQTEDISNELQMQESETSSNVENSTLTVNETVVEITENFKPTEENVEIIKDDINKHDDATSQEQELNVVDNVEKEQRKPIEPQIEYLQSDEDEELGNKHTSNSEEVACETLMQTPQEETIKNDKLQVTQLNDESTDEKVPDVKCDEKPDEEMKKTDEIENVVESNTQSDEKLDCNQPIENVETPSIEETVPQTENLPMEEDTEIATDAEVADADIADAEIADAEMADTEMADTEMADAEITDAEIAAAEITDTEIAAAEIADAEIADSESLDDDNSQSQDSQMSQSSQNSASSKREASPEVVAKCKSNQSTKISILNDWEDTEEDSQQSDIARRKAERTVHKLIDDWDDDEDDDNGDDDNGDDEDDEEEEGRV